VNAESSVAAIILAAGLSSRLGGVKKEFQKLDTGITVIETAVRAFASISSIQTIVIAIPANTEKSAREAISLELLSAGKPKILFVTGGNTRQASVLNALSLLVNYNQQYVLIHDGARPWVSPLLIENIIKAVKKYDAVIPLLPITETPKEITGDFINRHLKRANVGVAQTPQAFKFPDIFSIHEKASQIDEEFTDDAEIWGRFAGQVAVIPGESANRKITFPEDLY